MKAAWYEKNGNARDVLRVGELPDPQAGPGEVRVRLVTSGINPSDVKSRRSRPLGGPRIVPHSDGAGVIDQVGPGVDPARLGERVWIWNGQWQRPMGTAAELIALPQAQAVRLPDTLDFASAACLGIPALTAQRAVDLGGDLAGRTVLVTGAGNAVGHYITQMAATQGATVVATAGSAARVEHARRCGASLVIDYKAGGLGERIAAATQGRGVDVVIDMDFSTTARWLDDRVLRAHGHYIGYGSNVPGDVPVNFRTLLWSSLRLDFFLVYDLQPDVRQRCLTLLDRQLCGEKLVHKVGATFALDDIAGAHEAVERGEFVGNVVLAIEGNSHC